jgi:hypothetical protein
VRKLLYLRYTVSSHYFPLVVIHSIEIQQTWQNWNSSGKSYYGNLQYLQQKSSPCGTKTCVSIELSEKYVQKRKVRANLLKYEITTSQGAKGSFYVV